LLTRSAGRCQVAAAAKLGLQIDMESVG
jgi:hypothetical protein